MSNELKKFDIVAGQIQAIYENEHGVLAPGPA